MNFKCCLILFYFDILANPASDHSLLQFIGSSKVSRTRTVPGARSIATEQ